MQLNVSHHILLDWWHSPKNSKKRSQKTVFLAFFQRFFGHALLRSMVHALTFCQMKVLIAIQNRGKFHLYIICGSKFINFQMFSWRCSSYKMGPFWEFLGLFSPKYRSNLLKFGSKVVYHNTKAVCERCFKITCLSGNGTYPKFSVLVHFWAQFTLRKMKILPKIKILPETASLGLSDDTSLKSQINRRILIKFIKNAHCLGPKWA